MNLTPSRITPFSRVCFLGFFWVLLFSTCPDGVAEDKTSSTLQLQDIANLKFRYFKDQELGAVGAVRAIVQDSYGFMWFGGTNGLSRWDGYRYRIFQHKDTDLHSMSTNNVNDMAAVDNGDVWIATYWGLNRYQASTQRFIRYNFAPELPRGLTSNSVIGLINSSSNELWVATDGGGLLRYVPETDDFDRFLHRPEVPTGLSSNAITAIEEDSNGLIWVGLKNLGVDIFDPKSKQVVRRFRPSDADPSSLSHNYPRTINKDAQGNMWVGTYSGLNKYIGKGRFNRYYHQPDDPNSLGASNIRASMNDKQGLQWFGTGDKGVAIYNPETDKFIRILDKKRIQITALCTDASGAQWAGLAPGGAVRVDRYAGAITNYVNEQGNANSLSSSHVHSIAEDELGNLWVGTEGGLNYLDRANKKITRFLHNDEVKDSLPSPSVSSIHIENSNTVWVGTPWGGVSKLDLTTGKFRTYAADVNNPNSLLNREVWSLYRSSNDVLWVGTNMGGLHRFRPETNDFFRYPYISSGGSSAGRTLGIEEDFTGALWLSTDFGLYRLSKGNQSALVENKKMSELFEFFGNDSNNEHIIEFTISAIRDTFEDSNNHMWFATGGDGLMKWDRKANSVHTYHKRDGLIHNNTNAITEDDEGNIWVSTEAGISRLDPRFDHFKNFTSANGLPGNSFENGAAIKTRKGELVFGGFEGLSIINPKHAFVNMYQAPLVLTDILLFNEPVLTAKRYKDVNGGEGVEIPEKILTLPQSVNSTKELVLNHDHSVVTFEYILLSFDVSSKNLYSYKMKGFDETWTTFSNRRAATYTNLDPGHYQFQVKAMNNEGVNMDQELNIKLIILPPWWATWWAYSFYMFASITVILKIIYSQYAKRQFAESQNKLLEHKISERTKELIDANDELKKAYKKMEDASYTDALTGLRNRRYFQHVLPRDLSRVLRIFDRLESDRDMALVEGYIAFFIVDIDFFKQINDKYGHANGDIVIKSVANTLNQCIRDTDIVFRWGGEEFLIVCPDRSLNSIPIIAERIRKMVENIEVIMDNNQIVTRTCSVGYAHFPFDPRRPSLVNVEQTIDLADWCLYIAKNTGRNTWTGLQLNQLPDNSFEQFMKNIDERIKSGSVKINKGNNTN